MTDRHTRLSELMQARRLELGMKTWRALATEAEISYETLRALRTGAPVAPGTANAIEKALNWTPGSIDRVLADGAPAPADAPATVPADGSEESLQRKLARAHELISQGTRLLEEARRESQTQ